MKGKTTGYKFCSIYSKNYTYAGRPVDCLEVGTAILASTAASARPLAQSRWEHELVVWLEDRSRRPGGNLDVGDLAWSPENFERQRSFLVEAIERAALGSVHARALGLWAQQVAGHPRESIVVGRRWQWTSSLAAT